MKPIKALIVDDSSVMRKIIERSLRQAGIELSEVFEAANGVEALAALGRTKVDLILSDINMPIMDGLEFVRQLHCGPLHGMPAYHLRSPTCFAPGSGRECSARDDRRGV